MYSRKKKLPLYFLIGIPLIIQLLLIPALVGYFVYQNSHSAVYNMIQKLQNQTAAEIQYHIKNFLHAPMRANALNSNLLQITRMHSEAPLKFENHLYQQIRLFPSISGLYFGNQQGGLIDAGHDLRDSSFYVIRTADFVSGAFHKYQVDENGKPEKLL